MTSNVTVITIDSKYLQRFSRRVYICPSKTVGHSIRLHQRFLPQGPKINRMSTVFYVFFGLFMLYGGDALKRFPRIVGGSAANFGEFPYQVSLQYQRNLHCGGSIVDSFHVVTAAHCVDGFPKEDLSIIVGSADFTIPAGDRYEIDAVIKHPEYNSVKGQGWPNDIALLRTKKEIIFNEYVRPAHFATKGLDFSIGQSATVTGYGKTSADGTQSLKLLKTEVFIEGNDECQKAYPEEQVRSTNICTRHPTKPIGTCKGDSGGPLIVDGLVVGITSFSFDNGCAGGALLPQVFTRVSDYFSWIEYWCLHRFP